MSYIISSSFFKICISEQNCNSKHFKTQPRIVECETSEYFGPKEHSCPTLTFAVDSMNELCIDIYFTDKDKTFEFSVDKYYHTSSQLIDFPGHVCLDCVKMTGVFQINREILIPNNEIYRGVRMDHGLVIWIDEKPIGIFCRFPEANDQEKLNESLNIFDENICIERVLLLSLESMELKIADIEIKNKGLFEDVLKLISKMSLEMQRIEEKVENKCCSSSEK